LSDAAKIRKLEVQIGELETHTASSKKENRTLRAQLIAILSNSHSQVVEEPSTPKPSTVPYIEYARAKSTIYVLQDQLLNSNEDRRTEARARHLLMYKLRCAKATAKEWMNYAKQHESRVAISPGLLAGKPPSPSPELDGLDDIILSSDKIPTLESVMNIEARSGSTNKRNVELATGQNETDHRRLAELSENPPYIRAAVPSSQQETAPADMNSLIMQETTLQARRSRRDKDEYLPVIVSERPVKRRRLRRSCNEDEDALADEIRRIKKEPVSPAHHIGRTETLDLDDVGSAVYSSNHNTHGEHGNTRALQRQRSRSEPIEVHSSQPIQPSCMPLNELLAAHHARPTSSQLENYGRESRIQRPTNPSERENSHHNAVHIDRPPLESIDMNERLLTPRTDDAVSKGRSSRRSKRPSRSNAIHSVLEDGEYSPENNQPADTSGLAFSRLNALLDEGDSAPPPRITRASGKKSAIAFKAPTTPARVRKGANPSTRNTILKPPAEPALRTRPIESITLADFKLNPQFNHGVDYAFTDTFYGKRRQCLPGCVDPRCCGEAMRTLASTLRPKLSRPSCLTNSEDADLSDDERLVKWFLDAKWNRQHFTRLTATQRDTLILDAQTKLVAEQYGKHRTVSNRRMTPPGFWDEEIPSTQEQQELWQQAQEVERRLILQRHAEAMNRGKWLFRDE
jgi:DNA repair protein endonuclease SAE2/CtIP C-terminus